MSIWNRKLFGKHLVYYGGYINNILIIWQGDRSTVGSFFSVVDQNCLIFLDLELFHDTQGSIILKTHFKPALETPIYIAGVVTTWGGSLTPISASFGS